MTYHEDRMQKALLEILATAEAISFEMDRSAIFYQIGRIQGIARVQGEWLKVVTE